RDRVFIVERHTVPHRLPANRAIHRTAVDMAIAQLFGDGARNGPLARPGRTVDGDDQRSHEVGWVWSGWWVGWGPQRALTYQIHPTHPAYPAVSQCNMHVRNSNGAPTENSIAGRRRVEARERAAHARRSRLGGRRHGARSG